MQTAAGLLADLGDGIDAIKAHLATMDDHTLETLLESMPGKSVAGSAEMTMTILIYRELEMRKRGHNVVPFQSRDRPRYQTSAASKNAGLEISPVCRTCSGPLARDLLLTIGN